MNGFAGLTKRGQVELLRPIAWEVTREFGLRPTKISLVFHGYNTTFRVDTDDGRRLALRMNVGSTSSEAQLNAEIAWIRELGRDGIVGVAEPIPTPHGDFLVTRPGPLARPLHCLLYSWLGGRLAKEVPTEATVERLGLATAALHRHAASWTIPADCQFKVLPDFFYGLEFVLHRDPIFVRAYERSLQLFERLKAKPRTLIHHDLHLGNAKVDRNRLFIFDFDDAVLAWPILDSVVTLHSLRRMPNAKVLEAVYWRALGETPEGHGFSDLEFEGMNASRGLFIGNDGLHTVNPAFAAMAEKGIAATAKRLEAFERTGRYDPSIS